MKNLKLFLLLLLSVMALTTCSNSDDDAPTKSDPEGDCMVATINGESFDGEQVSVAVFPVGETIGLAGSVADITTGSLKTLTINIVRTEAEGPIPEGVYEFTTPDDGITGQYVDGPVLTPNNYGLTVGTLEILTHDTEAKRIEGNFQMDGEDADGNTLSVTNGYFDIKY